MNLFNYNFRHAKVLVVYTQAEWHQFHKMKLPICYLYEANALRVLRAHGPYEECEIQGGPNLGIIFLD